MLLILPRFAGHATNDAFLAVDLGPITFQPTELAKICIVVFLASYLNEHREVLVVGARNVAGVVLPPIKHLGPLLVVWGAAMVLLVFIRDLGSSVMFFGAFLALIYVATGRLSFVVIGLAMFVVGAWFFATHGRRMSRSASTSGSIPSTTPVAAATSSRSPSSPRPTAACSAGGWGSRWCSCRGRPTATTSRTAERSCPRPTPTSSTR